MTLIALAASSSNAFTLGSQHALVVDANSGDVIMEKNAQEVVPIASITKLMTGMVILDAELDMSEKITITEDDVDRLKNSSSRVPVGAVLMRQTLLELALMSSDNRAAHALARTYPGGMVSFLAATRKKIQQIGMPNTVIIEPTGLSPHNKSTAVEISKMAIAASRYPEIEKITTDTGESVDVGGVDRQYRNTNRLVGNSRWDILLSKTGYTREAGRCIVMNVRAAGRTAVMVLLNARESVVRTADAAKLHGLLGGQNMFRVSSTPRVTYAKANLRLSKRKANPDAKMVRVTKSPVAVFKMAGLKKRPVQAAKLANGKKTPVQGNKQAGVKKGSAPVAKLAGTKSKGPKPERGFDKHGRILMASIH